MISSNSSLQAFSSLPATTSSKYLTPQQYKTLCSQPNLFDGTLEEYTIRMFFNRFMTMAPEQEKPTTFEEFVAHGKVIYNVLIELQIFPTDDRFEKLHQVLLVPGDEGKFKSRVTVHDFLDALYSCTPQEREMVRELLAQQDASGIHELKGCVVL